MPVRSSITRRRFLQAAGLLAPFAFGTAARCAGLPTVTNAPSAGVVRERGFKADVVIIGGGLGGCAAALSALKAGLRVVLTEETDWIGGQITSQAVPPDENPWVETFGATRSYQQFREGIRQFYSRNYPLTRDAKSKSRLNPGNGWVSALCCEPKVALAVLHELFAPWESGGKLRILPRHAPIAASVDGNRVKAVLVRNLESGKEIELEAPYFVDATELGDMLPLTKTEYVTGAESKNETNEPHAPGISSHANAQAFTCCFAADYVPGEDHTIDRPAEYAFWRDYTPKLSPPWPGKLISWQYCDPITLQPKNLPAEPDKSQGLWAYRRIAQASQFKPGAYVGDITLVNWPQNDYLLGGLIDVSAETAAEHVRRAKQLSLSLLYWMQTEAPRPDGGTGWKGIRLRPDITGTEDGLAKQPYIRESRRIRAEFTVLEQHVSTAARMRETGLSVKEVRARHFPDSVGIGSYRIDLHPSTGGDNYIDVGSLPFQIPLGALLPRRMENLLPASKNIGVTHITNGCYRLHPVEWNVGEAVGLLTAFALKNKQAPRQVRAKPELLKTFQEMVTAEGIPLTWPAEATAR